MKSLINKISKTAIAVLLGAITLSSCNAYYYTCPTYSKVGKQQNQVQVSTEGATSAKNLHKESI